MVRRIEFAVAIAVVLTLGAIALADAKSGAVKDAKGDTALIKKKPEIDIVRASAANAIGNRVKHKVTMKGKLKPSKSNTRPFILINTKGGKTSDFEYLALGPRLFEKKGKNFNKVGAVQFKARKRTWIYRFKAKKLGVKKSYDWVALTTKGKARDLAPDSKYTTHKLP